MYEPALPPEPVTPDRTLLAASVHPGVARTRPRMIAAALALASATAVHLLWDYFVNSAEGQRLDRLAFEGAVHGQGRLWTLVAPLLNAVSVTLVIVGAVTAFLIAIGRKRWMVALQVVALVGGANLTTQVLKAAYPRPELLAGWTGPNSLPSGHTTVAASVSAAVLLAVPRNWRPWVALAGAAWTAAIGVGTLVGQWHRPSDVVAAIAVTTTWGLAACAAASRWSLDVPGSPWERLTTPWSYVTGALMLLFAAVSGAVAGVTFWHLRYGEGVGDMDLSLTAYVGGIAAVVAATAAGFAVLLLARQATAQPAAARLELVHPATALATGPSFGPDAPDQVSDVEQVPGPQLSVPGRPEMRKEARWPGNS